MRPVLAAITFERFYKVAWLVITSLLVYGILTFPHHIVVEHHMGGNGWLFPRDTSSDLAVTVYLEKR